MIDKINTWAGQIVIAVIAVTILEMILPEGNNKKYIKTIIGIYILFIIIYPIINYSSAKELNFETILSSYNIKKEYNNNNKLSIETNAQVEKLYKEELSKNIKEKIEEKNYIVNSLNLKVNSEEQGYGEITYLEINLSKEEEIEKTNVTNKIETVKIELSKKEEKKEKTITAEELNNLKTYLEKEYEINKDKIMIKEDTYDKE